MVPTFTSCPFILAATPFPGMVLKSTGSVKGKPRLPASASIASPSGCSLPFSTLAAICNNESFCNSDENGIMSVTSGRPLVMVPVLSSTTRSIFPTRSSASPDLNRIPISAARPVPTMMAVGVAKPMAHGQAITRTATMLISARVNAELPAKCPAVGGSTNIHKIKVSSANPITTGTKMLDT